MTPTDPSSADIVLVADLDGTLCRTDTLQEGVLALAARRPLMLRKLPGWLSAGRATFKEKVAENARLDPTKLPLNADVVAELKAARAAGRRTALVSAADERQVKAIAEATGLFDEAHGTANGKNLKGKAKAAFLTERFGEKGFDYLGDAKADLPVWAAAHQAITVGAGTGLIRDAEGANPNTRHISPPQNRLTAMVRALRPHQWSKNLLVFLPLLASHDLTRLWPTVFGFLAFCLVASSVYVINDLIDLEADRAHPRKHTRPFASGDLTAMDGILMAVVLLAVGLLASLAVGSATFLLIIAAYFAATFAYSFWLKRKLIIDVITLGGLYTIRIIAGGAAAMVPLSEWLLGFAMFLFLSLAAVKRQAELTDMIATSRDPAGRAYQPDDLPLIRGLALSAGNAAVLVLALYISSDAVQALYDRPDVLWLICPVLLYWILRVVMKAHRGLMSDDPIVFAATDRISIALILLCAAVTALAI